MHKNKKISRMEVSVLCAKKAGGRTKNTFKKIPLFFLLFAFITGISQNYQPAAYAASQTSAVSASSLAVPEYKDAAQKILQRISNRVTQLDRQAAADRRAASLGQAGNKAKSLAPSALMAMPMPGATAPDYFNIGNWAFTPIIRKFVDSLPGLGSANANNLGQYIPVAISDPVSYPGSDYYEIGLIQYAQKMHSDLPQTTLRGYVQLETPANAAVSRHIALRYPSGNPIVNASGTQVFAVDNPHYLGPTIVAQKDKPVRIKFTNFLPTGQGGDLFLPVDTTVMGAGMGPAMGSMVEPDPQNPMCGNNPKPAGCYVENRADLHLHGGLVPWISDGTPHQWTTPAGENTSYPEGVSVSNVPDMPDPGPGSLTFYYNNQQSARLMFYHDHSYGITRLNVYAGEAAPYLLTDATEQGLIASGAIPADQIPLIIQDKTFVDASTILSTDPTWRWGTMPGMPMTGDLWFPHVYMPNQNTNAIDGINPFGRWDYGPWFWPIWPATIGPITQPNGTVIPGVPNVSMAMEAFMDTPVVNGEAYPYLQVQPKAYRFRILNASDDRMWNLQLYQADPTAMAVDGRTNTEVKMIPATPGTVVPADWPAPDSRAGGLPDPATKGPEMVQIGTEGGFLPAPVTFTNIPIGYDRDVKSITVGNVKEHNLLLGPAERADVIVDFSQFAGKTLILYNDAPAALPAGDQRLDYYTGNPNLTATGGTTSTSAGFGPNTRTVMQIRVAAGTPAPFNFAPLNTALSAAFAASQDPIIVPQAGYNAAYNGNFPSDNSAYARIQDTSMTFTPLGSAATTTIQFHPKAIAEEFENDYGRMSAFLGLEMPFSNGMNQTTIFYGFKDPVSEVIQDSVSISAPRAGDGTQIWKITHNGVDTHAIHFHLFNVQVVNRVDWAGVVKPPEPNELGWKETVRMNPLEDVIVALRPISPKQPFGVPESVRPLDPTMPIGSTLGFKNVDANGNPVVPPVTNQLTNFAWEYVWHCHLLGHEEMDMMRPISFQVSTTLPITPNLSVSQSGGRVNLSWTDGTPPNNPATLGNPANEVGFRIERAALDAQGNPGVYVVVGLALANSTNYSDAPAISGDYSYQVVAYNAAGTSASPPQTTAFTAQTGSFNLQLNAGWNLLTLPLDLNNASTSESFGVLTGADVITGWATSTQLYVSHIVGLPINNFSLGNGTGFFAHKIASSTVAVTGPAFGASTPQTAAGWNLLGWNSSASTTAHAFGLSITGADVIAKFDKATQAWVSHIMSLPVNNFTINQGDGVFVHRL